MTNTIITVTETNYSEKVLVTKSNTNEVINYLHGKNWEVTVQGDIIIDNMENANCKNDEMIAVIKVGEKFLPIYEGCERPQSLKGGGYLHIYGARYYFTRYEA